MPYQLIKRTLDIVLTAIGLVILSPIFVIISIAIKWDSIGPVIYRGRRIGKNGESFDLLKFRSMVNNADKNGSAVTVRGDARITRLGRALRRWKLDELPNLINVLTGDMSLVGPRPECPAFVEQYTPSQRQVLSVKPGIACLAQIKYPNEEAVLEGTELNESEYVKHMACKLDLDLLYVKTTSFVGDLSILCCTVLALVGIQIDLEGYFKRNHVCHLDLS
jgi:lipopolysaccharide/colanic/teichoic acid biosynthesis glycosyltransferase